MFHIRALTGSPMGLRMGIKTDIKKVDVEIHKLVNNFENNFIVVIEKLHNLYIEHGKLAKRVSDLEEKSAKSNIIV